MSKVTRLLNAFCSTAWAIQREKLDAIMAFLELRAGGSKLSDEEIKATQAGPRPTPRTPGAIAVIPIVGVISQRMNLMSQFSGGTSTEGIKKAFRTAINDTNIKAIVFDVDSPGGSVDGVSELCDEIYNARGPKKIVAVCNSLMASAAYWIASAADEVVCTPSGSMGSIGVFMVHEDYSAMNEKLGVKPTYISAGKYKIEGNPDEPLTDDARQAMQNDVDSFYSMFVNAVARDRGVAAADVRNGFGQGRCLLAKDALKAGLCDRIATLDQTLARFGASDQVTKMSASAMPAASALNDQMTSASKSPEADNISGCDCECEQCQAGNCAECTNVDCEDPNCEGCPNQMNENDEGDEGGKKTDAPAVDPIAQISRLRREMDLIEHS